jgi:hypothetical protein
MNGAYRTVLSALPVLAVVACAAEAPQELRLLVKAAPAQTDASLLAERASRSSGRPVRYLAASGGGWHALALSCRGVADCEAAEQRLRADTGLFEAVQRDERKRYVSPAP